MAICSECKGEMLAVPGCDVTHFEFPDGVTRKRIKYGADAEDWGSEKPNHRCGDCGCLPGNYHHPGCDIERCAKCGGQAIGCACGDDEDDIEVDVERGDEDDDAEDTV